MGTSSQGLFIADAFAVEGVMVHVLCSLEYCKGLVLFICSLTQFLFSWPLQGLSPWELWGCGLALKTKALSPWL